MNTPQYLDALKKKLNLATDYALAKSLGIATATMSNYRNGKRAFDAEMSERVAKLLDLDPLKVIVDMEIDRAQTPAQVELWKRLARKVAVVVLAPLACGSLIAQSGDARANATTLHNQKFGSETTVIHIVEQPRNRKTP